METTTMKRPPRPVCWLASAFAVAALAAYCAPASAATAPAAMRAPAHAAFLGARRPPSSDLLFIPTGAEGVNVYDLHKPMKNGPITTITAGLVGTQYQMTTDAAGNLYVVNNDESNGDREYVTVYAPPYTGAPTILNGVLFPLGIAVDAGGNVYVSNCGAYCGQKPAIAVYKPGQTTPSSTITSPLFVSLDGISMDAAGNLDIANWKSSGFSGNILQIPSGSTTAHDLKLKGLIRPFSVAANPAGDIYVSDDFTSTYVLGFKSGKKTASVILDPFPSADAPEALAFGPDGNLYVPVYNGSGSGGGELLGFHGTKQFEAITMTGGLVMGVATYPNPNLGGGAR
jgi:hypothetical protein